MDAITNGLDTATTFDIINATRSLADILDQTFVISLLQPPPEVFNLFDEIILMSEGNIIYHGMYVRTYVCKYSIHIYSYVCMKTCKCVFLYRLVSGASCIITCTTCHLFNMYVHCKYDFIAFINVYVSLYGNVSYIFDDVMYTDVYIYIYKLRSHVHIFKYIYIYLRICIQVNVLK